MASNLRVDTILPSTGTSLGIGTASGTTTVTNNLSVTNNLTATGSINAASATITGNLGVGGVLTYEDVTNVDSVGVITARSGINVSNDIKSADDDFFVYSYKGGSNGQVRSGIQFDSTNQRMEFYTATNERLRIDLNGNITAYAGNIIIGTAGKGIDYSAQSGAAAGMASELLDHYEEGTFTPTFGASNGSSTAGYSTQSGKYTRIGNIVHVQIRITLSSLVTNSHSHAWISGLPIASAERTATSSIVCGGMQGSGYNSFPIAGRTEANATRIELFQATNGGVTDFGTGDVSGTAYFIVQCTYRAA